MPRRPMTFDEFQLGQVFTAGPRTISRADIDAFSVLSGDHTRLHSDEAYARTTPFGGLVAHGALVLSAATGLAFELGIFEGTVLAVHSMNVRFERPVFPGDALTLQLTVITTEPQPRPDRGRVSFSLAARNQLARTVLTGAWILVLSRAATPGPPLQSDGGIPPTEV